MAQFARFHWLLLLVAFGVGAFCWIFPHSTRALGLDFWNNTGPADRRAFVDIEPPPDDERSRLTLQRLNLKLHVTRELVAGRIDLATAAEQFQDLNGTEPAIEEFTLRLYPAETPEISHALQVLNFAQCHLAAGDQSGRMEELESELCTMWSRAALLGE